MAKNGLTNHQMAEELGISPRTFDTWRLKHPEFRDAVQKGKDFADTLVQGSLLQRALGFDYEEITKERVYDKKTEKFRTVVTKKVKKRMAPEVVAQIFWLKNRKPKDWRDRKEHEITGDIQIVPAPVFEEEDEG